MKKTVLAMLIAVALAGCGRNEPMQQAAPQTAPAWYGEGVAQAPAAPAAAPTAPQAPVVVQQAAPHQDNTVRDMLLGGMIGHTLGGMFGGNRNAAPAPSYSPPTRIIERRTIINNVPAPAPAPVAAPRPVAPAPAPVRPSYSQAYNAAKPSVAPSRPSYGSFGRRK
jgi:hypothetical protein